MGPHCLPRVIFINRFFYPDHAPTSELLSDLAFALRRRGIRITVITSRLQYDVAATALPAKETIRGVDVLRVRTSKRGRQRLIGRSLDYLSFYLSAGWRLWRLAGRGDIVVAKTDPPLLSLIAAPIAWLRGARLVNWLQDVFPETAEVLRVGGRLGNMAFRLITPLRNWSLLAAVNNVVVGEKMAARLIQQGIARETIRVIPNWSDGSLIVPIAPGQNELRKHWVPNNHFVVGYAGNLGRAHDVATVVDAMTLLQEQPVGTSSRQIMFMFIGGGVQRAALEREVLRRRLANVRLYPYQPRALLAQTLSVPDLHIVSLNPKLEGLIVPSKFYGIAAAGRPALFIGSPDGEIARLIKDVGCGFTVAPGDGKALMDRIMQLATDPELCASIGARARAAFEQRWDKEHAIEQWQEAINRAFELTLGEQANTAKP